MSDKDPGASTPSKYMDAFIAAVGETFDKMVGLEATPTEKETNPEDQEDQPEFQEVVASLSFKSDLKGSASLSFPSDSFPKIASAFAKRELTSEEDLCNACGELINIVAGRALGSVSHDKGVQLGIPTSLTRKSRKGRSWRVKGSETFELPFSTAAGNFRLELTVKTGEDEDLNLSEMTALVVDDSETQRRLQSDILTRNGFGNVLTAVSGLEAITRMAERRPDIILLDWNMPKMDGFTLATKLRKHETLKEVPIIMVTSEADKRKVLEALKLGIKNYIVKPFDERTLWSKVEKVLRAARK